MCVCSLILMKWKKNEEKYDVISCNKNSNIHQRMSKKKTNLYGCTLFIVVVILRIGSFLHETQQQQQQKKSEENLYRVAQLKEGGFLLSSIVTSRTRTLFIEARFNDYSMNIHTHTHKHLLLLLENCNFKNGYFVAIIHVFSSSGWCAVFVSSFIQFDYNYREIEITWISNWNLRLKSAGHWFN